MLWKKEGIRLGTNETIQTGRRDDPIDRKRIE